MIWTTSMIEEIVQEQGTSIRIEVEVLLTKTVCYIGVF